MGGTGSRSPFGPRSAPTGRSARRPDEARALLVTGATGVVGRLVVPHLLARGHRVTAVGRTAEKRADLAALGADAIALDLLDAGAAARAMKGPDALIRAAGRRSWRRWSLRGDPDSAPDAVEGQATCWYTRSLSGRLDAALEMVRALL